MNAFKIHVPEGHKPQPVSADIQRAVEQFLYREARILDNNDYNGWLTMLADDIHYWMPIIENRWREDPKGTYGPDRIAYFDDDLATLQIRVSRFEGRTAWAENPATRHVHVITNIEVETGPAENEYIAHSAFVNYRNRDERDEDVLVGRRRDIIRNENGHWKLAKRRVLIAQNVLLARNINTFL